MPTVAWATESARAAFVLFAQAAGSLCVSRTRQRAPHKLQEGCIWPGHPSRFARSPRTPTSCPAYTLEQPEEASPAIPLAHSPHDWRAARHQSRFGLASLGDTALVHKCFSQKGLWRGGGVVFSWEAMCQSIRQTWLDLKYASATCMLCDLMQLSFLFWASVSSLVKWGKSNLPHRVWERRG